MSCQELPQFAWSLLPQEWRDLCAAAGQPAFRAKQLWHWLYRQRVASWEAMSNLPAAWRAELAQRFQLNPWRSCERRESADGVVKLLLQTADNELLEAVLIPAPERLTLCLSTQAGCAFRCAFCATGQSGLSRNLAAGEIVGQLMTAADTGRRITNLVFMGMGEPFDNYDATLRAIRTINVYDGLGLGARRMTISTCGVVPGIERLAGEKLQVELSVSLHAPNDTLRSSLMPVNRRWPLALLMPACSAYTAATGRIITFEYTLVAGVNDSLREAEELCRLLQTWGGRVNLIPLSPVAGFAGEPPGAAVCEAFAAHLSQGNINVTLRRSRGGAIDAACGQLRLRRLNRAAPPEVPPVVAAP